MRQGLRLENRTQSHAMSSLNHAALSQAAAEARGLAIDAVHKCNSGHLGLPLGAAEIGAVLFGSGGGPPPTAADEAQHKVER